jgi:hypothetical protein
MKVENENLIILTKKYLIIEKIFIINNKYTFKNIISKKLNENLFEILDNNKFVSFDNINLKIFQFSNEENSIKNFFKFLLKILILRMKQKKNMKIMKKLIMKI